jgi:hypothetical protein
MKSLLRLVSSKFRRPVEASAYQRCLAVHIHFAAPGGSLS